MGRRKGKERRDKQILMRVSNEELHMIKEFAKEENLSMSEFIRKTILNSKNRKEKLDVLKIAAQKYESILEKFRILYSEYKRY
ncbi:MAG: DUF6290 family protein [Spirochaetes bacterium]|nr:DUF6290 family protein [Spirochaetota bacterium]